MANALYMVTLTIIGAHMPVQEKEWEDKVKRLLKAELARKGITYAQLVGKLADVGVMDSEPNIRNKISRGKFTAVFLVQCLQAIGCSSLHLD
ncbi:DUF6471 domain-containing protein [Novosphingobium sp. PASSN1]|uniref:DUF6471 domain-containing protein n=1 Tax=Novosphingobium sp. PASSN1 TaxID=2015561 RepID=UPI0025E482E1|nr:DUF6471 domain-containing protein [Novosphingobium sp. PASSN1]